MEFIDTLPINILDIGVGLTLLISGVLAYARGLAHETLALGGWVGAIFSTIYFYPIVQPVARDLVSLTIIADLGTGVVIFVTSLVLLSLLTRTLSRRVKESGLGALDRALGFLFGVARGALLLCVASLGLDFLMPKSEHPDWIKSARTMPIIAMGAIKLREVIPETTNIRLPKISDTNNADDIIKLVEPTPKSSKEDSLNGYSNIERKGLQLLLDQTHKNIELQ